MPIAVSIVEDNEKFRGTLARVLNRADGFQCVSQYGTAEDALKALPQDKPEVVLMDINLPDIDGMEATSRLKANPQTLHIPIVALTANAMHGDRERFLAAGCDGYLAKPISKNELLNTVAFYLENDEDEEQAKLNGVKKEAG